MTNGSLLRRQFEFEIDTWKRTLGFIADENNNSKYRVSEIVKDIGNSDGDLMDRIEYFHNSLLKEDEIIDFLYMELSEHKTSLLRNVFDSGVSLDDFRQKQERLRNELDVARIEFFKLNLEFNDYLCKIL